MLLAKPLTYMKCLHSCQHMHCALNPMCFENAGHLGRVTEDDISKIQRILLTLPKFPLYFGDVILTDPAQMSVLEFQGTVRGEGK